MINRTIEAIGGAIGWAVIGAIGSLITGLALRQAEPSINWKLITIVSLGWAIGGAIGWVIVVTIIGVIGWAIGGALIGAIGGGIMFWQLNRVHRKA